MMPHEPQYCRFYNSYLFTTTWENVRLKASHSPAAANFMHAVLHSKWNMSLAMAQVMAMLANWPAGINSSMENDMECFCGSVFEMDNSV
jgi:hypothetical protein